MRPSKIFVIAEIGVNHNGSAAKARLMTKLAQEAGADAVKFQMFSSRKLWGDDRITHLELDEVDLIALAQYCDSLGIEFMCTPFGVEEVLFINGLVKRHKIASGCLTKGPLLEAVRDTGKPVILSTGMSTYGEIRDAIAILRGCDLTLLHCTSAYPCPLDQVNMKAMQAMRRFGHKIGYSDHTEGTLVAQLAVAAGAAVIEKHVTLDRNASGPDHKASIDFVDLTTMIRQIERVELVMGEPVKAVMPAEAHVYKQWRAQ